MPKNKATDRRSILALKVHQWLPSWEEVPWDPMHQQGKPKPFFYMFNMQASHLKALTGVYRRTARGPRSSDYNIQRTHEVERSNKIKDFVMSGFPWCELSQTRRDSNEYDDLKKPGWLPTAIVVNILGKEDNRIERQDVIEVEEAEEDNLVRILLPKGFQGANWRGQKSPPLEVIDGQHRLWAFEGFNPGSSFELPVVAFHNLNRSWQAYLFWSINVSPKRINRSLAFDLYPLLRKENWLEKFYGHSIYKETRAQELVEALWSNKNSPWHQHINMLGEKGLPKMVSQASWIRSLVSTVFRQWDNSRQKLGGLFGAPIGGDENVLPWSRAQQAAFLISAGKLLRIAVKNSNEDWCIDLRERAQDQLFQKDAAFYGKHSLLNSDQGIRAYLYIINDFCYYQAEKLDLFSWSSESGSATDQGEVLTALKSLEAMAMLTDFINSISLSLAKFDWRSSNAPGLTEDQRLHQAAFRGSSGYGMLRQELIRHLASDSSEALVVTTAKQLITEAN